MAHQPGVAAVIVFRFCDGAYRVRFSYDPDLVELLKTTVPAWARSWDPGAKEWAVRVEFGRTLASAIGAAGHQAVGLKEPRAGVDGAGWGDVLLDAVGPTRHQPVFRALTKILHPDAATGDGRLQQQLSDARERFDHD
jgi:hypothetical protein